MSDVRPGQIWEDKDKRMRGRRVRVETVVGDYAFCRDVLVGKSVRLLLRRMGPRSGTRGWRLATNWSERIPAAIADGEEHVNGSNHRDELWRCEWNINKSEVALAKLAARRWEDDCEFCQAHREPRFGCHEPPPELIDFCEKMEALHG